MAIESERLLAIFEARFSSLEKALSKARGDANKAFGDISAAGTRAESVLAKVGSRGMPGLASTTKQMNALRGQTGNLAAQFNDIGVQLASGTSPFLIAIQQGSQINQVLGQAGARGAVSALGGAFFSMLNPVSLATFAIIGLGGAAIQYFTGLLSNGEKSADTLKQEAQLIQQVADKWGVAYPALKAYADERKRLADQKALEEGLGDAISQTYEDARSKVEELAPAIADLEARLREVGAKNGDINALQAAFGNLETKLKDNKATADDVKSVLSLMFDDFATTGISDTYGLVDAFKALVTVLDQVSPKAAQLTAAQAAAKLDAQVKGAIANGQVQLPQLDPLGFIDPNRDQTNRANATQSQTQTEADRASWRGGSRQNDYQRQTEQITKRTAALSAQTAAQAGLDPLIDDFGQALETARARQDLLTAAQQAGLKITPEMSAQIDALANSYGVAYAEAQKLAKSQDEARRSAQELNEVARNTFGTFISDLAHGKSATEALTDALSRLGDKLLEIALDDIFGTGRGGSGGGLFGSLISSFFGGGGGGSTDPWLGLRANGGPVEAGKAYIVGEKRPELFVPRTSGTIIPQVPKIMPGMGGSSGPNITYAPTIDARGADSAAVARIQDTLAKDKADFSVRVVAAVQKAKKSNVKGI
jgi:hypothetical protein